MFYSAGQNAFYHPAIHSVLPPDAVQISDDEYAVLLLGQQDGREIVANAAGGPALAPIIAPTIEVIRAQAKAAMEAWIAAFLSQFTAGVSAAELASWSVKAERARAHIGGTAQPMIVAEAAITGEDATVLAQKIAAKADAYEAIIARVTGLRRATEAAISKAGTPEAVAAILAGAKNKANTMAAQMGRPVT